MRALLDEALPRQLADAIQGHDVTTVRRLGWQGLSNGALLQRMVEGGIGVLVTADRNFEYQQNLGRFGVGLVVLVARSNSRPVLLPLGDRIAAAISAVAPGQVVYVRAQAEPDPAPLD